MSTNLPIIGVVDDNHSRVKYEMGIFYYEDNMYFKKDMSCYGVYKIKPYTYEFSGEREKISLNDKLTRMFWNIGEEFQLIDMPIETSMGEEHEKLKKMVKGSLKFEAIKEIDRMTEVLTEDFGDKGNKYETYLIIKLNNPKSFFRTMKEFTQTIYQDPIRLINKISGLNTPEIYKREYEIYKQIEDINYSKVNRQIGIQRANEYEIQKLIKYLFYFGIGAPLMIGPKPKLNRREGSKVWSPKADRVFHGDKEYIRPREKELIKLTECGIDINHPRSVEINQFYKGAERKAYQAYIAVADIPDGVVPGGEWHYYLKQSLDFPIYTSVRGRVINNKVAKDELNRKKREIDDQDEHIRKSQGVSVPIDIQEQVDDAMIMEAELKAKKFPLIYTTIIIAVAADNKEELSKRIDAVRSALDPIPVEIPAGDQWLMMNEAMIGGAQYQKDYLLRLPPGHIALMTPGASLEIGDEEGIYIGITGALKKPVKIAPWIPSRINRPPNATFTGTMGGGKSFTNDMIVLKTAKLAGAYTLFIDPKGDRSLWPEKFKSFKDEIRVTTFTADREDFGKLDPFIIMKTDATEENMAEKMKEATVLALDICMFLLAVTRKDPELPVLFQAVQMAERSDNPAMTRIIEYLSGEIMEKALEDQDDKKANICRQMASTLNTYKDMAFAGLLFGRGDEESVNLTKQVNVLQIQNLVFPEEGTDPENFTFQESIGYACILAITGYIKKFIMGDKTKVKMFVMDESTVMKATPAGKNTMNSLNRMARSLNAPGWFIGQSVDDMGDEKVRNNIGYKFAFRTTDYQEIKKVLAYFKLEENENNIEMLSNLDNGVCLFQDHAGRTAVVAIDYIFDEYHYGLDTRPPEAVMVGGE